MIRRGLYSGFSFLARGEIARLEADSKQPAAAQQEKLLSILRANATTEYGKAHSFSSVRQIADFRQSVPINDYEDFRPAINRMVAGEQNILTCEQPDMFATTSGTSGNQKLIPVTPSYMKEFRSASVASGYYLLKNFPGIAGGVTLSMVSSAEEGRTTGGIPYGAISGQLLKHEPGLIKKYISPIPYEVFLIKDYETRYYAILRIAIEQGISCIYMLNPSTIVPLCRRLRAHAERLIHDVKRGTVSPPGALADSERQMISRFISADQSRAEFLQRLLTSNEFIPAKIWPQLAVVSCWTKAAAAFYLEDFPEFFAGVPVCDITYGASEGRGTVFIGPNKQMLALHCHFFEFVPESEINSKNPSCLSGHELELGQKYFILFTTSAGLYRYNINDVVEVTGFHNQTPLIEFRYKGGNVHSFTGEKITELQVTSSVQRAMHASGIKLRFFTLVPHFRPQPHYQLWFEVDGDDLNAGDAASRLADAVDEELRAENSEYKTKRESARLGGIVAMAMRSGSYESLRKSLVRDGIADSQIKLSHLNPKDETRQYFAQTLVPQGTGVAIV